MMSSARYLTKSLFKLATQCPRKLYYAGKLEYANARSSDEFLSALADGGYQVGALAKAMHPEGIEILADDPETQIAATREALSPDTTTVFEAAFSHGKLFARVDILLKRGTAVRVAEVKSKGISTGDASWGSVREVPPVWMPYLLDVAFQAYVVRGALPGCRVSAALIVPDKTRAATVNGLNQLFPVQRFEQAAARIVAGRPAPVPQADQGDPIVTTVDVTHLVDELLSPGVLLPGEDGEFEALVQLWSEAYQADERIDPSVGSHCKSCEFRAPRESPLRCGLTECWSEAFGLSPAELRAPLVIDLWDGRRVGRWLGEGKPLLRCLTREDLGARVPVAGDGAITRGERQWMQISGEGLNADGYAFRKTPAAVRLAKWKYPLNFIDFETSRTALPSHAGGKPFELIAFQFSHHVLHADGALEHAGDFLCTEPGRNPNLAFLRGLRATLSRNDGTVMMWSPYENSVLNVLLDQLRQQHATEPDVDALVAFVEELTVEKNGTDIVRRGPRAMVDLRDISSDVFFHERAGGSNSIKKVLPAMLSASAYLRRVYERADYGGGRANSRNFDEPKIWWDQGDDGHPVDPYRLLPSVFDDLHIPAGQDESPTLADGGAALIAYARLQFESIAPQTRCAWNRAMLRYCELDTLAMAMVVQGWRAWVE